MAAEADARNRGSPLAAEATQSSSRLAYIAEADAIGDQQLKRSKLLVLHCFYMTLIIVMEIPFIGEFIAVVLLLSLRKYNALRNCKRPDVNYCLCVCGSICIIQCEVQDDHGVCVRARTYRKHAAHQRKRCLYGRSLC